MSAAAIIASALLAVVALFQLALAAGAPWGAAAWGGKYEGVLPGKLRAGSAFVGAVVYPMLALAILRAANVIDVGWISASTTMMWALTAFFAVGAVANLASRSRIERIWAPVAITLAVCCAVVARS